MISYDINSIVLAASQQLDKGNSSFAMALCEAGLELDPDNPSMLAIKGFAYFMAGKTDSAYQLICQAIEKRPQSAVALYYAGEFNRLNNRIDLAFPCFSNAARLLPFYDPPVTRLCEIRFKPPDYFYFLTKIHEILSPKSYFEIGVMTGDSFKLAGKAHSAIGVDPNPGENVNSIHSHGRIFRMTSDDFFSKVDVPSILMNRTIDLSFIDGMHLFEYVLRDFANVEQYCHNSSVILLHDCLPVDEVVTLRDRRTGFWTGDTWKIVPCLRKHRPDLRIHTIDTPPSGLTIVSNLNPNAFAGDYDLKTMIKEFLEIPFRNDNGYLKEVFGMLPNVDESIAMSGIDREIFSAEALV